MDSYTFSSDFCVTEEVVDSFNRNGGITLKGVLDNQEVTRLLQYFTSSKNVSKFAYSCDDGQEGKSKLVQWNHPGNDISGIVARSEKIAGTFESLLGGEVYHYHSKLMMKDASVGGAHSWHQDYGYWYKNGILTSDMGSVFIALDKCTKDNSCLQVLSGSHAMGRLDHMPLVNTTSKGDAVQFGADPTRIKWAKGRYEHVHCELDPGDAIFFHSNLLHCSDKNYSMMRRWVLICAYNRADNNPLIQHYHPQYTPLVKVNNSQVKECSLEDSTEEKWWVEGPTHKHK